MSKNVVVEVVEQPVIANGRFRYECEGTSKLIGANSIPGKTTYPAFRLLNYTGAAVAVVSCVSKDEPHWPHPHRLVGKKGTGCDKDVCKIEFKTVESAPTVVGLRGIGIQICKIRDIEQSLALRASLRIDPFKTKYKHTTTKSIDLSAVRLCFQVLLESSGNDESTQPKYNRPVPPIVSDIIRDKKYVVDLMISEISDATSPTTGGKKIMIFCSKVWKDDIRIRFFKENGPDSVEWEKEIQPKNVHRQVAISFNTPAYMTNDIEEPACVYLQIVRPSDGQRSKPLYFRYVPDYTNINNSIKNKKRKMVESEALYQYVQEWEEEQRHRSKMEMNIPNIECNQVSNEGAAALPVPVEKPNIISNFSSYGSLQQYNNSAHGYQLQQPYYYSQRLPLISHTQPQPQFSQPLNNQLYNSHMQHSHHFQPQLQNHHFEHQSPYHLQQQSQNFNISPDFIRPPTLAQNSFLLDKPQPPTQMYSTPGFNPFPNQNNAELVNDSKSQNVNQLCSTSNTTLIAMGSHQQTSCEDNIHAENIIENVRDSVGLPLLGTMPLI